MLIHLMKTSVPHAAALVRVFCWISVTAVASSCKVTVFCLLLRDSREASELTSLSRTVAGNEHGLARKSAPFKPTGTAWRRKGSFYGAKQGQDCDYFSLLRKNK